MSKATVVAMGNTSTCSYCRALKTLTDKADFESLMPGADFVFADQSENSKLYASWKSKAKMSGSIPVIAVFDSAGVCKGKFVARTGLVKPFTAAGIVAKIKSICPTCCIEGGCEDEGSTGPTGGTGSCSDSTVCKSCGVTVRYCPVCGKELC